MKSSQGKIRKRFGWSLLYSTEGFSLLELSVSIFFTALLCSYVLFTAVVVWRAEALSTSMAEQSGMTSNTRRVLTGEIDRAMGANFNGGILQFTMVDGMVHRLFVNSNHQLILVLQNGGNNVVADSVQSFVANIDGKILTLKLKFVSGNEINIVADMLGGLVT